MDPRLKLYLQKWRWYERNSLPWRRARIHLHMLRAEAFIRFPDDRCAIVWLDARAMG